MCGSVRIGRIGWVIAFAATTVACVSPAPARRQGTVVEMVRPHDEPELVSERPSRRAAVRGGAGGQRNRPGGVHHRVQPGETLYRIALNHGITVDALMAANGITDPRSLSVGQELSIPKKPSEREVAATAASASDDKRPEAASSRPRSAQRSKATATARRPPREAVVMPKGAGVLSWPLRGVLYARFGKKGREQHDGIDLAAPSGTPVKTARAGKVLYAGEQKGYGLIVIIDHGDDLITLYAHNRDLRVKSGQRVRDGQVVATVGESGRTSGPHLHFEVRQRGIAVDPLKFLGAPPDRALGRRGRDAR